MTHHLDLDPRAWEFVAELLRRTRGPPGGALAGRGGRVPAMTELRLAGPDDRDPVAAFLHERMSSKISLERWRRLFDYGWLDDKPDCGVVVIEEGSGRRLSRRHPCRSGGSAGGAVRTANLSSWYIARSLRGQGLGLAMLELATRDPGVTYTTFSSNPPALRLMAKVGLGLLDQRTLPLATGRRGGRDRGAIAGLDSVLAEVSDHERQILEDHRDLPVQPRLLRAPEGDCLVILSVKQKGADVAYHEVLHLGRPAVLARHAQAFANLVLAPGASVLAVDTRIPGRLRGRGRNRADRACRAASARPTWLRARSIFCTPRSRCSTSSCTEPAPARGVRPAPSRPRRRARSTVGVARGGRAT